MSLEIAAKRLAAKGRKGDTLLVHMHPKEVAGLQALALKNGTSMTINPSTGLPEAFGLKNILPMIAGAVGGYFGGPWGGAAASGATTKLLGGSDKAALMSGVGGYMGAGAAGSAAGEVAAEGAVQEAAQQEAQQLALAEAVPSAVDPALLTTPTGGTFNQQTNQWLNEEGLAYDPYGKAPSQFSQWQDKMGGSQGIGKAGLGVLAQAGAVDPTLPEKQKLKMGIQKYEFDPRYRNTPIMDSRERRQFDNQFTKGAYTDVSAANGGLMRLAAGGETKATAGAASTTGGYRPEQVYGPGAASGYAPRMVYGAGAAMPNLGAPQAGAAAAPAQMPAADASQMYLYNPGTSSFTKNPLWLAAQEKVAQEKAQAQQGYPDTGGAVLMRVRVRVMVAVLVVMVVVGRSVVGLSVLQAAEAFPRWAPTLMAASCCVVQVTGFQTAFRLPLMVTGRRGWQTMSL